MSSAEEWEIEGRVVTCVGGSISCGNRLHLRSFLPITNVRGEEVQETTADHQADPACEKEERVLHQEAHATDETLSHQVDRLCRRFAVDVIRNAWCT